MSFRSGTFVALIASGLMVIAVACSSRVEPEAPAVPATAMPAAPAQAIKAIVPTAESPLRPASALPAATAAPDAPAMAAVTTTPLPAQIARPAPTAVPAGTIKRGGTFTIGTAQPVQFLDPHRGGLANNRNAFVGMFNSLTDWDFNGLAQAELAESWDFDAGSLSWTIHLQRNVKFHHGRAFTAQDVKLSLDRIFDPDGVSFIAQYISEIDSSEIREPFIEFGEDAATGVLKALNLYENLESVTDARSDAD